MASSLVRCGVVSKGQLWQVAGPVSFLSCRQGAQQVMQGTVKSFTLSITLGMVRCGSTLLYTIHLAELLNQHAFKVPPLVILQANACVMFSCTFIHVIYSKGKYALYAQHEYTHRLHINTGIRPTEIDRPVASLQKNYTCDSIYMFICLDRFLKE